MFSLILLAAGSSIRSGLKKNKVLTEIAGDESALSLILSKFKNITLEKIYLVLRDEDFEIAKQILDRLKMQAELIKGGKSRQESVLNALKFVKSNYVIIHDGARCYTSTYDIENVMQSAEKYQAASLYSESINSLCYMENNTIIGNIKRETVAQIETPQAFNSKLLKKAYKKINDLSQYTDDSSIYIAFIGSVHLVKSTSKNIKLTQKEDFYRIKCPFNYGIGFDLHKLEYNRDLILGGIKIDYPKGLIAHSDGDCLIHAIMDAILSACSQKDIGHQFPDTDNNYKNIDSKILLAKVRDICFAENKIITFISATIIAQEPKMAPYLDIMRKTIADILQIPVSQVNISASTTEKIGIIGNKEAIAAQAIATVYSI